MFLEVVVFLLLFLLLAIVLLIIQCERIVKKYESLVFLVSKTNEILEEMVDDK